MIAAPIEIDSLPNLSLDVEPAEESDVLRATCTDGPAASSLAPTLAPKPRKGGLSGTTADKSTPNGVEHEEDQRDVVSLEMVNRKEPQSIADNGSQKSG